MSRKQESQTPLASLKHKLKVLGFEKELAARHLLECLASPGVPDDLVDAVNNMVSIAVITTKRNVKKSLQALADTL